VCAAPKVQAKAQLLGRHPAGPACQRFLGKEVGQDQHGADEARDDDRCLLKGSEMHRANSHFPDRAWVLAWVPAWVLAWVPGSEPGLSIAPGCRALAPDLAAALHISPGVWPACRS